MNNVFQQGAALQMQQIPFNQIQWQPIQHMPNLVGLQFSQNMLPYAQLVIQHALNEVQAKMTQSPPRVYFFNVMAANGFDNVHFRGFVQQMSQFIEMVCVARGQVPQVIIPDAADTFTTYSVAAMAMNNPTLINAIFQQNQQMANMLQETVNQFNVMVNSMRGGGQPAGGMRMGVQQQPNYGGGNTSGLFNQQGGGMGGGSGAFGGLNIGTPTGQVNTAVFGDQGNTQAAQQTLTQPVFTSLSPTPAAVASLSTAASGVTTFNQGGQVTIDAMVTEKPSITHVGGAEDIKWKPSEKFPLLPVYDPNKEELKFHVYSDGSLQPVIAQKVNMDRTAHLAPVGITPKWASMSQQLAAKHPANAGQPGADKTLEPADLKEVLYPENATTVATHKESWLYTEAHMLSVRSKYPDKAVVALKYAMLTDSVIASSKVVALVDNLLISPNAKAASDMLAAAFKTAALEQNHLDIRAIKRLVKRLTDRVNRFVTLDMSLNFGRIEDYIEDAPALAAFLKDKLGQGAADVFDAAHSRIVGEAINVADETMAEAINQVEFNHSPMSPGEDLSYIHMYSNVVYCVADVSTTELRAEIPKDGHSALISENSTPLLYDLAKRLFNKKTAESKGGAGYACDRYLLRTNDGVALEFTSAAFAATSYLVALHPGE